MVPEGPTAVINQAPDSGRFPRATQPVVTPGAQLGWFTAKILGVAGGVGTTLTFTVFETAEVHTGEA